MRLNALVIVTALLLAGLLSACNSAEQPPPDSFLSSAPKKPTPAQTQPTDDVRRVTVEELKDLLAKGEAVVIDVRNQASFDAGHIKGARLIPHNEVQNHVSELPTDKLVVTYCS